jgi:RNA polymerase sigma-70 factor (ECF subfamily)
MIMGLLLPGQQPAHDHESAGALGGQLRQVGNASVVGEARDLRRKVAVTQALRTLPAAHREILNETILRGRTVNEAAEALGIPVATVKSRVYHALRALRLVIAEFGPT